MTDNKRIHLAVWTAWLVLHGYLLCFRFSLSALAVLAIAAGILLLSTYSSSKYEDSYLSATLGNVLGSSLFVQLGWYFAENILPRIMAEEEWLGTLGERIVQKLQGLLLRTVSDETMLIPLCIAVALYTLRLFAGRKPRLSMLASYAGNAMLVYPILNVLYRSHTLILLYTVLTVVFLWVDLWNIAVTDEWNKSAKRWANWLTLLLVVCLSWDWYMLSPLTRPGALETIFVLDALKWYHLLVAGLVLAGLAAAYETVAPAEDEAWADARILTAMGTMLLLAAFLKWFYVGWWWLLVAANVLYLLADALLIYPNLGQDKDTLIAEWGVQLGLGILSILVAVMGHFGTWPMLLALLASALVVLVGVGILLDQEKEDLYLPGGVLTAILAVLIPTLVWLWMYRRLAYSFQLVLILAAVFAVIGGLLCLNICGQDRKNILAPVAAAAAFAVLALNLTMTGGSRIEMELNERGVPVVTVEARGEENRVVSTEYRWTPDWLDLEAGKLQATEEVELTYLPRLTGREGKLRVIVTDSYGIVTESIFWVHHLPQSNNG